MRTILAILFLFILVGVSNAQLKGVVQGDATIWTDSLGYSGSAPVNTADSVWIFKPNFNDEWYRIFVKGNANSSVDSIYVKVGTIRYNNYNRAIDTLWGSYATLKDSGWNTVNVIVNNTVGKDFTLFSPVTQLLQFGLLNYRAALTTRNVEITVQGLKRK